MLSGRGFKCFSNMYIHHLIACIFCHCHTLEYAMFKASFSYYCSSGGYYQPKIGQSSEQMYGLGCDRCVNGTFVSIERAPGKSPDDCTVCPTGTDKTKFAGFRACPCLENYYRTDRFGSCQQCPSDSVNCSMEYQKLKEGFWWTWNFEGNETLGKIRMLKYNDFVTNILTFENDYNQTTTSYNGILPMPFKCKRNESCPINWKEQAVSNGINPTCGTGYEGWLCSQCSSGFYSWFEYCVSCPEPWKLALEAICFLIIGVLFVAISVWDFNRQNQENRSLIDTLVARFKIVLGYYQLTGAIFSSIHNIHWPAKIANIGSLFRALELNIFKLVAKPRCLTDALQLSIYNEFQIGVGFCLLVVLLPLLLYAAKFVRAVCRFRDLPIPASVRSNLKKFKEKCYFVVVLLLFITYLSICQVIFGLMPAACQEFCVAANSSNNSHCFEKLRSDYSIDCNSKDHKVYQISAYVTLIYVIGFPLFTLFLTYMYYPKSTEPLEIDDDALRSRDESETPETTAPTIQVEDDDTNNEHSESDMDETTPLIAPISTASDHNAEESPPTPKYPLFIRFLCENYNSKYWFWEIVELSRKVLQTVLVVLYGSSDPLTLGASIILSVVFIAIHAYFKPMKDRFEHWLQMLSLLAIFLNLLSAVILMIPYDDTAGHRETAMTVFIIGINVSVIMLAVGKYK